jgi:hypothetical protein
VAVLTTLNAKQKEARFVADVLTRAGDTVDHRLVLEAA